MNLIAIDVFEVLLIVELYAWVLYLCEKWHLLIHFIEEEAPAVYQDLLLISETSRLRPDVQLLLQLLLLHFERGEPVELGLGLCTGFTRNKHLVLRLVNESIQEIDVELDLEILEGYWIVYDIPC